MIWIITEQTKLLIYTQKKEKEKGVEKQKWEKKRKKRLHTTIEDYEMNNKCTIVFVQGESS